MIFSSGIYPAPQNIAALPKGALTVKVQSVFNANCQTVWEKLQLPATLSYIASPILSFKALNNEAIPLTWQTGNTISLRLFAFGFIPLGKHTITITQINSKTQTLATDESGAVAPIWKHSITLVPHQNKQQTLYTDEVVLYSGMFPRLIACWALWFYRHRQKRWVKLLQTT